MLPTEETKRPTTEDAAQWETFATGAYQTFRGR
jgi:hypothetical protein